LSFSDSSVIEGLAYQLGISQCRSKKRHRVVVFRDHDGHKIRVRTNFRHVSIKMIAEMYQVRWSIEVFFRWINVPTLFGTSENAVYNLHFAP
jgi:IS4 transposase